jgi:hypothetical protein
MHDYLVSLALHESDGSPRRVKNVLNSHSTFRTHISAS